LIQFKLKFEFIVFDDLNMSLPTVIEVVDDNADIRRMMSLVLKTKGLTVRTHESAEAFLAAERPAQARLLILDVRMPGMTGLELHSRLLVQGEKYPVIFMSGECQPHETTAVQASTPIAFLWKPFNTQQLLQAIEEGMKQLSAASA
jgi:FixJ family two-component response regulator